MKTNLTVLIIGLLTLSAQSMGCCKKTTILPYDITIAERNFQDRLALIRRINAEQARKDAREARANTKYRQERTELFKGAAERAAKKNATYDIKITALANETLQKPISFHEKRWDLIYLSKCAATNGARTAIQAKCNDIWEEMPPLELPRLDPRAYLETSSEEASPKEPTSC